MRWPDRLRPTWRVDWIDLRDVHVYAGLTIAVVGGVQISLPWTLVVLGATLAAMGLFLQRD